MSQTKTNGGGHDQDDPQGPAPGHLRTALLVVVDVRRRHRDSMQPRIGQVKVGPGGEPNAMALPATRPPS